MAIAAESSCSTADALDDIEEMTAPANDSVRPSRGVARRVVRRAEKRASGETEEAEEQLSPSEFVPGTQSIYVKTYGCSHNHSDSEYMCGLLAQYGYKLVGEVPAASRTRSPNTPAPPSLSCSRPRAGRQERRRPVADQLVHRQKPVAGAPADGHQPRAGPRQAGGGGGLCLAGGTQPAGA